MTINIKRRRNGHYAHLAMRQGVSCHIGGALSTRSDKHHYLRFEVAEIIGFPGQWHPTVARLALTFTSSLTTNSAPKIGHVSVDQIAVEVGYAIGMTLRALLRRKLGIGEICRSP